jgi:hypothetical protein
MSIESTDALEAILSLPSDWHDAGTCSRAVYEKIIDYCGDGKLLHSAETGAGVSTLLFSHLSEHHTVFARLSGPDNSASNVMESALLRPQSVEWVDGPTQYTLPQHAFDHKLQAVLIDGPHAYPYPDLEYYYFYQNLDTGSLLIIDDIQIPTIRQLSEFLKADDMFDLLEVVDNSAFFRRTDAPMFNPAADRWWEQKFNNPGGSS